MAPTDGKHQVLHSVGKTSAPDDGPQCLGLVLRQPLTTGRLRAALSLDRPLASSPVEQTGWFT